jgi:polysaccharide export outer membrane protein
MPKAFRTAKWAALTLLFFATPVIGGQNQPAPAGRGAQPTTENPKSTPPAGRGTQPAPAPPAGRGGQPATPAVVEAPGINVPAGAAPPPGYVIGPDDVLQIVFWREPDISGDVVVRPDGVVSLPLINDVVAAGLTPEQLRAKILESAVKFLTDPNVNVSVKQINSRKVYITGMVNKIGAFTLTAPTTVLQLISMAGGLQDYADKENISIVRMEKGKQVSYRFNYKDVVKRRNLEQNIQLQPGDVIVVP